MKIKIGVISDTHLSQPSPDHQYLTKENRITDKEQNR